MHNVCLYVELSNSHGCSKDELAMYQDLRCGYAAVKIPR